MSRFWGTVDNFDTWHTVDRKRELYNMSQSCVRQFTSPYWRLWLNRWKHRQIQYSCRRWETAVITMHFGWNEGRYYWVARVFLTFASISKEKQKTEIEGQRDYILAQGRVSDPGLTKESTTPVFPSIASISFHWSLVVQHTLFQLKYIYCVNCPTMIFRPQIWGFAKLL